MGEALGMVETKGLVAMIEAGRSCVDLARRPNRSEAPPSKSHTFMQLSQVLAASVVAQLPPAELDLVRHVCVALSRHGSEA